MYAYFARRRVRGDGVPNLLGLRPGPLWSSNLRAGAVLGAGLNWSDEHYVKLYTRDSLTWRSWHWEARTVFLHLVRKVDNSGFIETGRMSIVDALVLQLELPKHVVEPGMSALIGCGTCEAVDGAVLLTKFNEAQEARKTDAQKKRDERSRNIAKRRAAMSPAVTGRHPPSPSVTGSHPNGPSSPAQPRPAQPELHMSATADLAVERVFAKYQQAAQSPRSKLDDKRRKLIRARLKDFTEADLCRALDGYARSPHHQGQNDRNTRYVTLELWFRDTAHVEAGMAMVPTPTTVPATAENIAVPPEWQ